MTPAGIHNLDLIDIITVTKKSYLKVKIEDEGRMKMYKLTWDFGSTFKETNLGRF